MSLIRKVFEVIKQNPEFTNSQIADVVGCPVNSVSAYISRMVANGFLESEFADGKRVLSVLRDMGSGQNRDYKNDLKRDIYQSMLEAYLEDFESAQGFSERAEIGKLILRLLEKL